MRLPFSPTTSLILLSIAAVSVGATVGLGGYTFFYAQGASYLSNDPRACANCHVMELHYSAWMKSSHHAVATCNDCHTPASFVSKYWSKAQNGFWHSVKFTTGNHPDPLRIKPFNLEIVEQRCRTCHAAITDAIDPLSGSPHAASPLSPDGGALLCTHCHAGVGHPWRR